MRVIQVSGLAAVLLVPVIAAAAQSTTMITTTADFQKAGNNEGFVSTAGDQLTRDSLTSGRLGAWSATTPFATSRYHHTCVSHNGHLYVLGGYAGATLNDVQHAPINANGTVGAWSATTSFATPRYGHASVVYNGYLYVLGGSNTGSGSALADVQYAPINPDGTVGAWAATTPLPSARYNHSAVVYNGRVYVMGGASGSTMFNDVLHAPINADGTLGSWAATTPFASARYYHSAAVYGGYLYVIGGLVSGSAVNDVQYAAINPDGTVGTWTVTTPFPTPRYNHTSAVYNGYVYVIGGDKVGGSINDVQNARINPDGTVGVWMATTPFPTPRNAHASTIYNGNLYVLGGSSGGGAYDLNDVQFAKVEGLGTVGAWSATTPFVTSRYHHTCVSYSGHLYVLGGYAGASLNDVQHAPINANGTVGAWSATTSFATQRWGHASVVYNGYLYVLGGDSPLADVQYAPINPDGTVGAWAATTPLPSARYNHSAVVYNGRVYVMGGASGSTMFNDVLHAPINADGTLGSWAATTPFASARYYHSAAVYGGYLYVIGGLVSGSAVNDVQYAAINPDGTVGPWSSTTPFPTARYNHTSAVYNGYVYVIGGDKVGGSINDVQNARINPDGTVGVWMATTPLSTPRNAHASAIYNGTLYVLGGSSGGGAYDLNDVQFAPLCTPALRGYWSKLVDLGADAAVGAITVNGSPVNSGTVRLQYRLATSSNPAFAAETVVDPLTLGAPIAVGTTARYVWIRLTLDDTETATQRDVTDILIDYTVLQPTPVLALTPSGLTFAATQGGADPAPQTFGVSNAGGAGSTLNFTLTDNAPWLSKSPTSGSLASGASQTVTVSPNIANLTDGTYTGTITVADPAATNNPQTLGVTLTVSPEIPPPPPPVLPTIALDPPSLSFSAVLGGGVPPSQAFTVTSTGPAGSALSWTATWVEAWIFASPATGSLASGDTSTLTVFADPSGKPPGTYTSTITIADPNATNTPQAVAVTLTVADDTTAPTTTAATATPNAGTAPLLVVFQVGATDDVGIVLYRWDFDGNGDWDFESDVTGTAVHLYASAGTFNAKVRVQDGAGNVTDATVPVTVVEASAPTGLGLVADKYTGLVPPPLAVTFTLQNAPTTGLVAALWDFDGDLAPDGFTTGLSATHPYTEPGMYLAHAIAVYEDGSALFATLSPGPVEVTFDPNALPPPTAILDKVFRDLNGNGVFDGGDVDVTASLAVEQGDLVGFEYAGSVSDPSLSILKYEFDFTGASDPDWGGTTPGTASWLFAETGQFPVTLMVADTLDGTTPRAQGETTVVLTVGGAPGTKLWIQQPKMGESVSGTGEIFVIQAVPPPKWVWGPQKAPTTANLEAATTPAGPYFSLTDSGYTTVLSHRKFSVNIPAAIADGLLASGQVNWFRVRMQKTTGEVQVSAPVGLFVGGNEPGGASSPYRKVLVLDGNRLREFETPRTAIEIPYGALVGTVTVEDSETGPPAPDGVTFVGVSRTITATAPPTKPVRVRIYWPDADGDGIVDGTSVGGSALKMFRQRADGSWEVLTAQTSSPGEAWVEATTTGFSVFALGTGTPKITVSTADSGGDGGGGGCGSNANHAGAPGAVWLALALLMLARRAPREGSRGRPQAR